MDGGSEEHPPADTPREAPTEDGGSGEGDTSPPTASRTPAGEARRRRKRRHERFRVPSWVILVLGPLAGWVVASWMGALLGLAIGVVAWQSKR